MSAAGFARRSCYIAAKAYNTSGSCQSIKTISNRCCYRYFNASPLTGDTSGSAARGVVESSLHVSDRLSVANGVEDAGIDCTLHIGSTSVVEGIAQLSANDLGFSPVHIAIQLVENIHIAAGIPYWEAIALSTLGVRLVLLPTAMIVARDVSKMRALKPELKKIRESMNTKISPDDPTKKFKYIEQVNKLFASHNVEPLKTVCLAAFQFPIFVSFFFGMRQMGNYFPGFSTGGGDYWFADLSAADPTYILPCVNSLSFLLMVEVSAGNGQANPLKWPIRGVAALLVPLMYTMPQGVFFYMLTNTSFSILQMMALKNDRIRDFLGLMKPPPDDTPIEVKTEKNLDS